MPSSSARVGSLVFLFLGACGPAKAPVSPPVPPPDARATTTASSTATPPPEPRPPSWAARAHVRVARKTALHLDSADGPVAGYALPGADLIVIKDSLGASTLVGPQPLEGVAEEEENGDLWGPKPPDLPLVPTGYVASADLEQPRTTDLEAVSGDAPQPSDDADEWNVEADPARARDVRGALSVAAGGKAFGEILCETVKVLEARDGYSRVSFVRDKFEWTGWTARALSSRFPGDGECERALRLVARPSGAPAPKLPDEWVVVDAARVESAAKRIVQIAKPGRDVFVGTTDGKTVSCRRWHLSEPERGDLHMTMAEPQKDGTTRVTSMSLTLPEKAEEGGAPMGTFGPSVKLLDRRGQLVREAFRAWADGARAVDVIDGGVVVHFGPEPVYAFHRDSGDHWFDSAGACAHGMNHATRR